MEQIQSQRTVESVLELVGHRVAVKVDEVQTQSEGGILLVQDERLELVKTQTGCVVSIGPDCWKAYRKVDQNGREVNGQPWVGVGQRVLFTKYASQFIEDPETKEVFALMNDSDIIAKVIDKRLIVIQE